VEVSQIFACDEGAEVAWDGEAAEEVGINGAHRHPDGATEPTA